MKGRERLDRLLVERGLCESRTRAQALVLAGKVVVDDHAVSKPGTFVPRDAQLRLRGEDHPYVSRGGLKLRGALAAFAGIDVRGRWAMDVGASTGGFTDCLLQAGVEHVFAVDVGYGQLAWKLARDPRVSVLDRQNVRELTPHQLGRRVDLVVADCSFISLRPVLDAVVPHLQPEADVVALVKPQFEVGRERVGKGGIVRDPRAHQDAIEAVSAHARSLGFRVRGKCRSPIEGKEGNVEFFVWLSWSNEESAK
jgi:23S rRNA (cytidine1920-2'-O)/16S rRNA (cytidine1409-2'-O)-methyltransferase